MAALNDAVRARIASLGVSRARFEDNPEKVRHDIRWEWLWWSEVAGEDDDRKSINAIKEAVEFKLFWAVPEPVHEIGRVGQSGGVVWRKKALTCRTRSGSKCELAPSASWGSPQVRLGRTTLIGSDFTASGLNSLVVPIPFAKPPIGNLRFQPPVLTTTLSGPTFDASNFGAGCLQTALPPNLVSEDCLTLNVFRPVGLHANASIPILFWIYGGGFVMGASSLFNGTAIVSHSVARVTIFGESAGATSIQTHLLGPTINGLVRAAIIESSAISPTFGPEHNEASWQAFVAAVPECAPLAMTSNTFDCLLAANSSTLLQALVTAGISGNGGLFSPVIDGPGGVLPRIPSTLTPQTHFPVMIGTNLDEGTLFTPQDTNSSEEIFETIFVASSPSPRGQVALSAAVTEILALYPNDPSVGSPFGTGTNTFGLDPEYKRCAAIFGDFVYQSPRRAFAQSRSKAGGRVFSYHFIDPDAVVDPALFPAPPAPGSAGITHSSEIAYDYWISFASSLDPNDGLGNKRPQWSQYTPNNQVLMQLNGHNTTMISDDFRAEQIAFINADPLVFHR
ncbi:Alpha/Beta hydrolase protein [Infundibulicybe gibba]|nr:Alpha/Beta hydrolase protein [Infundibulicybe gibba]